MVDDFLLGLLGFRLIVGIIALKDLLFILDRLGTGGTLLFAQFGAIDLKFVFELFEFVILGFQREATILAP